MSDDIHLIPFKIQEVQSQVSEVPEGVKLISAPYMWGKGIYGEGVVVAILDTGIQTNHPDLAGQIIGGRNFSEDYNNDFYKYEDNNGHGTHVAGTIAAVQNNTGVVGIAPKAKLLIGKVLSGDGSGSYDSIINGIKWATQWRGPNGEKVRIISMSLGGPDDVPELKKAIQEAVLAGILVVCAAGNEGDSKEETFELGYPGNYNEVIEVGAVDKFKELAYFSNNNTEVDCVAPGVGVKSTYIGSRYAILDGTSMATPHVAGALALLVQFCEKEFRRPLTEAELYAQLIKRTQDLPYLRSSVGNGMVKLDQYEQIKTLLSYIQSNFC